MPRENSFSDGDSGRSLTPDLDEAEQVVIGTPGPTSPTRSVRPRPMPASQPTGRARFKAVVKKVMALHRTSTLLAGTGGAGAEPGVDPRRATAFEQYGHVRQRCVIEVTDYSSAKHSFGRMSNEQFVQMLNDERASQREHWAKVRWINIAGVSWDVISALAIRYDIHPLALEDILHQPRSGLLSKVDYYTKHLFMRILCHTLAKGDDHDHDPLLYANPVLNHSYTNLSGGVTGLPRSSSPTHFDDKATGSERGGLAYSTGLKARSSTSRKRSDVLPQYTEKPVPGAADFPPRKSADISPIQMNKLSNARAVERLKHDERVNVHVRPMCIMLFRDGTVISISPGTNLEYTAPILARLKHRDTSLRVSPDGSFLVQALLDLIVDRVFEVVDEYQAKIVDLERRVLVRPKMKAVRDLHILQGDLNQHKRTLEPVKTVAYGLRRYDVDRVAAMMTDADKAAGKPAVGYMSHKAKIYLADVVDHMDYVLASLEMFSGTTENLINYTFNMASNEMNEVMKRLTLATIVFLPLTLLSGYFGMNFQRFTAIAEFSDAFFWAIGIPLVFVTTLVFMWNDFVGGVHFMKKRMAGRHDASEMIAYKRR